MSRPRKNPVRNVVIPLRAGEKAKLQAYAGEGYITLQTWLLQYVQRVLSRPGFEPPEVERAMLDAPTTERLFFELPKSIFDAVADRTEKRRPVDVATWILGSLQPLLGTPLKARVISAQTA